MATWNLRFFRWSLALIWLVIAGAKVSHPSTFFAWLTAVFGLQSPLLWAIGWTIIVLEAVLGALIGFSGLMLPRHQRSLAGVSWVLGATAAVVSVVTREMGECGCFGALLRGGMAARLIVAGAVMWISFEFYRHVGPGTELAAAAAAGNSQE